MDSVFNTFQETKDHICGAPTDLVKAPDDTDHESNIASSDNSYSHVAEAVAGTKGNAFARVDSVELLKSNRMLLHPMTVLFPESKVTAIMGPSGSGKSTLLNFITGSIQGNLKAKGEVNLAGQMGFVPQHDHLHGFYTCRTYMNHYTRLAGMKTNDENTNLVKELLKGLGMENHADTIVGDMFRKGLSGGQKRRLSVALESLSRPETLFLDEPTSGLDSESAFQVMKFLDEYARHPGRRVILTIHQPSSFIWDMIDHVVLLSKGKLMYQGPRADIESYFAHNGSPCPEHYNPADHYVTVVNDEFQLHTKSVEEWANAFLEWQASSGLEHDLEIALSKSASFPPPTKSAGKQVSTAYHTCSTQASRGNVVTATLELTRRYLLNLYKNPGIIGTRLFMYGMLAVTIGILFWDLESKDTYSSVSSRIALLFYCVAFFVFMSVAAVPFAVIERGIVEKEVMNGYYHPAIFQLSQAIASIPGTFLLALVTTIITTSMTGLHEPLWYFLNMFLALNCAEALAQLVSHVVPHFIIGIALIAGLYGMFMLLQGFMMVPSEFPSWLSWSYKIAFHTYSWRTFMYKEFSGENVVFNSVEFPTGMDVLRVYEIENVNPTNDMIVLFCYSVIIHILSFIVLHLRHVMHKAKQVYIGAFPAAEED